MSDPGNTQEKQHEKEGPYQETEKRQDIRVAEQGRQDDHNPPPCLSTEEGRLGCALFAFDRCADESRDGKDEEKAGSPEGHETHPWGGEGADFQPGCAVNNEYGKGQPEETGGLLRFHGI